MLYAAEELSDIIYLFIFYFCGEFLLNFLSRLFSSCSLFCPSRIIGEEFNVNCEGFG